MGSLRTKVEHGRTGDFTPEVYFFVVPSAHGGGVEAQVVGSSCV
jgi:hypothetical protein